MTINVGEHRRVNQSIARIRKNGKNFEVIIDCETALKVREGKATAKEALLVENVFKDAQKGDVQGNLTEDFGTDDVLAVAEEIIKKGELQLTEDYRKKVTEEKRNQVLEEVTRKASDPTTHYPVPRQRIELAMNKLGYKIRYEKGMHEQVKELIELLPKAMPITFNEIMVTITSPPQFTSQTFGIVKKAGELIGQDILPDGSVNLKAKVTGGGLAEMSDKLKSLSHGLIKIKEE